MSERVDQHHFITCSQKLCIRFSVMRNIPKQPASTSLDLPRGSSLLEIVHYFTLFCTPLTPNSVWCSKPACQVSTFSKLFRVWWSLRLCMLKYSSRAIWDTDRPLKPCIGSLCLHKHYIAWTLTSVIGYIIYNISANSQLHLRLTSNEWNKWE